MSTFSADWTALLIDAVKNPGVISIAYSRFWNYSTGNQLLALSQCMVRNLEPGPINTFLGWKDLGRQVTKGQKALTLCMPVMVKDQTKENDHVVGGGDEQSPPPPTRTGFIYRPNWFVLCQTEGKEYVPAAVPGWIEADALASLGIERVAFKHLDGNCQGYALDRQVAVSLLAVLPHKTLFHEVGHVVLGHTDELGQMDDGERTPVNLREVEAECVALICCECLNLPGSEFCRGYIQHWLGKETIPDRSAQKIFKAADQILKAGRPPSIPPSH